MRLLLAGSVDISIKDDRGYTPLEMVRFRAIDAAGWHGPNKRIANPDHSLAPQEAAVIHRLAIMEDLLTAP
eukprot:scaffold248900_cov43-Prasinocladus_malaysianus.AAC.2